MLDGAVGAGLVEDPGVGDPLVAGPGPARHVGGRSRERLGRHALLDGLRHRLLRADPPQLPNGRAHVGEPLGREIEGPDDVAGVVGEQPVSACVPVHLGDVAGQDQECRLSFVGQGAPGGEDVEHRAGPRSARGSWTFRSTPSFSMRSTSRARSAGSSQSPRATAVRPTTSSRLQPVNARKAVVHVEEHAVAGPADGRRVRAQVEEHPERLLALAERPVGQIPLDLPPQGDDAVAQVLGEALEQSQFLLAEPSLVPRVHGENPDALPSVGDGERGGGGVAPAPRFLPPGSEHRLGVEVPTHHHPRLPRGGPRRPPALGHVGPDHVDGGEVSIVVAGVGDRADGPPLVGLGDPHPAHPVAAGLDDDAAHLLEELVLGGSPEDGLVAPGDHEQHPAGPVEGRLRRLVLSGGVAQPRPLQAATTICSEERAGPQLE